VGASFAAQRCSRNSTAEEHQQGGWAALRRNANRVSTRSAHQPHRRRGTSSGPGPTRTVSELPPIIDYILNIGPQ